MTELIIDGVSAVLSKDFSIQVKRENPLFTKNGEYTYDITLPLDNPTNAELYKHLNRLNSTQTVSTDRRAVLVADNRVYCNGTEVITGWTEDTVSIQIASGNSELNWVIGADLQISFLDGMPETPALTASQIMDITESVYPDVQFNLPPVYDRTNDTVINGYWVDYRNGAREYHPETDEAGMPVNFYPQPYLCAYLHALFEALGYELQELYLDETEYKNLIICHAVRSMQWKDFLPGWSVKDFLEQVELMFNASVVVDNKTRTARIVNNSTFYAGQTTVHVTEVEDPYEVEKADEEDEPEAVELMQSNVRYAFPTSAYWKSQDLPDSVVADAKHKVIPEDWQPYMSVAGRFMKWFEDEENQDMTVIHTDGLTGEKAYISEIIEIPDSISGNGPRWYFMDHFHRIEREDAQQEVELKITPAEMSRSGFYRYVTIVGEQEAWGTLFVYLPVVENAESQEEETGVEMPITELLESSSDSDDEENSTQDNILLAFYVLADHGSWGSEDGSWYFPSTHTDTYIEVPWAIGMKMIQVQDTDTSLGLESLQRDCWEGGYDIDLQDAIKISCHDPNLYDTRYIFEIRNKRYVCREMEFTLDAHGRKGAWTGTFYPIHISDTEADARWILTDGKWRDGGVWLDNGRWLDQ